MRYKQLLAAFSAALCLICCASCGKETTIKVDESVSGSSSTGTETEDTSPTVGELVEPKEDSAEYELGSYRMSSTGIKFYFDDTVPVELMYALDKYFTSFQNSDFETYKTLIFPDYAERYGKYLDENYQYGLDHSFELSCQNLRSIMQRSVAGHDGEPSDYTGDFTITRIKAEPSELEDSETSEEHSSQLFTYLNETFGMDYYQFVEENSDEITSVCFYIYAKGEDDEEHLLISGYDIVFAVKDGNYYAFG